MYGTLFCVPVIFKMAERGSSLEGLEEAFLRHRQGGYDSAFDEKLKIEGERILRENDPSKKAYRLNAHSVFWMVASMCVFYYTDFYMALKIDPRVHRTWLAVGGSLIAVNLAIGCYLIVYCSYIKGISDWETHHPFLIPVATASFIAGFICCTVALWPVWGILTPVINFTLFMGVIFLATLVPV